MLFLRNKSVGRTPNGSTDEFGKRLVCTDATANIANVEVNVPFACEWNRGEPQVGFPYLDVRNFYCNPVYSRIP